MSKLFDQCLKNPYFYPNNDGGYVGNSGVLGGGKCGEFSFRICMKSTHIFPHPKTPFPNTLQNAYTIDGVWEAILNEKGSITHIQYDSCSESWAFSLRIAVKTCKLYVVGKAILNGKG
ncbi:MAG: hypothetical protein AAGM46_28320 [Cyanobacteria bacterium J06582_2]